MDKYYIPSRLQLQWHITEHCNLRCSHCYQENYSGKELSFEKLIQILEQYKSLINFFRNKNSGYPIKGHITMTGGEPFIRNDFFDFLNVISENKNDFSFSILTNGSLIDKKVSQRLKKLNPKYIQVSVEGNETTHNKIRGKGNFSQTVSAIKCLVKESINTFISFTAHRLNFKEFPEVAQLGRQLKVSRVWADRLIPSGNGTDLSKYILSPEETHEFFEIMNKSRKERKSILFHRTNISMHRALQFLVAGGKPYHCTAGNTLVTVQPNGDLYPCRRMPIKVGNLMETSLKHLYYTCDLFKALRNESNLSIECKGCFYSKLCRGGLKCLSYAVTNDPFLTDPGCWMHSQQKPKRTDKLDTIT